MALETVPVRPINDQSSSPRISFSVDFLDDANFISINPHSQQETEKEARKGKERERARAAAEFEFLASSASSAAMLSADELFFDGKLLPFWQMQQAEKLNKISIKSKDGEPEEDEDQRVTIMITNNDKEENRVSWFIDDDPSPRPPKCTVLWKELLRLKKQRASSLSPSSSSSSTSSSSSSLADVATEEEKKTAGNKEKQAKRMKKGLERTRSATIRIRPMINVPICTQTKSSSLPPLFPLRKSRVLERSR